MKGTERKIKGKERKIGGGKVKKKKITMELRRWGKTDGLKIRKIEKRTKKQSEAMVGEWKKWKKWKNENRTWTVDFPE